MNSMLVGYLGFVVAALILIWAVFELMRRYNRKKISAKNVNAWVKLDATPLDSMEEALPLIADEGQDKEDEEETPQQSLRTRSQQNGHYSESKKPH